MRKLVIFLFGFIAGVIATWLFLIMITFSAPVDLSEVDEKVTTVEITGKNGVVTLYTGMPKDSVKLLVGKPDEVDLREIGHTFYESWGYKIKNEYYPDLRIEFEDGRLEGLSQD